jgi:hypothetical protein
MLMKNIIQNARKNLLKNNFKTFAAAVNVKETKTETGPGLGQRFHEIYVTELDKLRKNS